MVALSGVSAPRRSVASSTPPAAVTAAMTETESPPLPPPRPLQLPGSFLSASYSTASGTGQAAKVVTVFGRKEASPAGGGNKSRGGAASEIGTTSLIGLHRIRCDVRRQYNAAIVDGRYMSFERCKNFEHSRCGATCHAPKRLLGRFFELLNS